MVRYQVRRPGVHLVSWLRSCRRKQRQEWYKTMVTSRDSFTDFNGRHGWVALLQSPEDSDRLCLEIVAYYSRCWQVTRQQVLWQATLEVLLSRLFLGRSSRHQERRDVPQRLRWHCRRSARRRLQQPGVMEGALLHNHWRCQLNRFHTRYSVEDLDSRRGAETVRHARRLKRRHHRGPITVPFRSINLTLPPSPHHHPLPNSPASHPTQHNLLSLPLP